MAHKTSTLFGAGARRRSVRVLFSCAGRRIELMQAFRRAARSLGIEITIHATDAIENVAAFCFAERAHHVPQIASPDYVLTLLDLAEREKIDLLVPLLDPELLKLAEAREAFAKIGCGAIISSPAVIRVCRDKLDTYEFLTRHQIDTPATWLASDAQALREHSFPYFLKPRGGSASKGNFKIDSREDLDALLPRVPDAILQEFVPGVEHTLDVYTGLDGVPRCVVPRRRIEVHGGEVTKARTVRHQGIIDVGVRVAEALRECVGLITIQLFLSPDGRIRVIEINPRFGGGVPLGIKAGANFPKWLLLEWLGRRPRIRLDDFKDGMIMMRYHQSYFVHDSDADR